MGDDLDFCGIWTKVLIWKFFYAMQCKRENLEANQTSIPMDNVSQSQPVQDHDRSSETEPDLSTLLAEGRAQWNNPAPGRIKRFARWFYNRFVRFHGSVKQVAWGAALGVFVAMSPTMGFQMAIAIPIAAFFKISKLASAAAVWVTNPATAPFIYWFNFKLGAKLLGYPVKANFLSNPSWETFWRGGTHVIFSLTLGGVITGIILAVPSYFIALAMVKTAREKAHLLRHRKTKP
jgi:uncharacterized protein (DUF2062 family)